MTAFVPRTASLDQTLRALSLIAQSAAFTTEVQAAIAAPSFANVTFSITDANGASIPLTLADTQTDNGWVSTSFAEVQVSEGPRLAAPFPRLTLLGQPGRMQTGSQGAEEFRGRDFQGLILKIDAIITSGADDAQLAQRESLILAEAFASLLRRNEQLGGLVELVQPSGPVEPGGVHATKAGIISGARLRLEAYVLRP